MLEKFRCVRPGLLGCVAKNLTVEKRNREKATRQKKLKRILPNLNVNYSLEQSDSELEESQEDLETEIAVFLELSYARFITGFWCSKQEEGHMVLRIQYSSVKPQSLVN